MPKGAIAFLFITGCRWNFDKPWPMAGLRTIGFSENQLRQLS
jgi:hypothetical protein